MIGYAPPDVFPQGIDDEQVGTLVSKRIGGADRIAANITRFERRNDPDREGFGSNPCSVLSWDGKTFVADAAGDSILRVTRGGKVRLFHTMKEYGAQVDAVPTVLAPDKKSRPLLVGELHSEQPGKARVWRIDDEGRARGSWKGPTTVTGVARARNGTLYVSELFGGSCGFQDIPTRSPGRVVKVAPNGKRTTVDVPFPAGLVLRKGASPSTPSRSPPSAGRSGTRSGADSSGGCASEPGRATGRSARVAPVAP